jgi:hypothetical protein
MSEVEGGIVVSLFLMVAAITFATYASVTTYVQNTKPDSTETPVQTQVRMLAASANLANCIIHLLLIMYMNANAGSDEPYWAHEREIGADGIGGPVFLAIFNFAAGICSLKKYSYKFPLGWNSFVIFAGTMIPLVWQRFLDDGMASWPYIITFIWFAIFSAELTAFATSLTYYLLVTDKSKQEYETLE